MKALHSRSIATGRSIFILTCCILLIGSMISVAHAQARHSINSDGTDFFLGMMPTIPKHQGWQIQGHDYILITSYFDNNSIQVDYFGPNVTDASTGSHELAGHTYILNKGMSEQFMIDLSSMAPLYPGEDLEYKACHIHSRYPISVQYYSDGSSSGSLYQGIPTPALGTNYVVAAWNDMPLADSPNPENEDSASSEFEIIAPYDNTHVTFTPNSTTYRGVIGVNSGAGSNGTPHPVTITMNRGQVYWVRSLPENISDDMSGSTVVSDKPVAVLGGCELMLNGDMQAYDENIMNSAVEEMTPVQDWGSDYPSIPTMPASNANCNTNGLGDFYRVYSNQPNGVSAYLWDAVTGIQGPAPVYAYQNPPQNWQNIEEPVDLVTDTNATGPRHTMYAVQCLYFQGVPSDEESDRAPELMNLIPIDRFRMSSAFMIPNNSTYHGAQYINVITNKDSLQKVLIYRNGGAGASLEAYGPKKVYTIPDHPELAGLTIQLTSASYLISGNTPFAAWSYGRTEPLTKDVWGYGAPIGQGYGISDGSPGPKAVITPSCGEWNIHIQDSASNDQGLADVVLLNDPDGFIYRPAMVSNNCRLYPTSALLWPNFQVGQKTLDLTLQVQNPNDTAFAALYIVDRSGNDTVIQLHYLPPAVSLSERGVTFPDEQVTQSESTTVTFHVTATGGTDSLYVPSATWAGYDTTKSLTFTTVPPLPAWLKAGDSVVFTITYAASDTFMHYDTILLNTSCIDDSIGVRGLGRTPIIFANNLDFGNVPVGDTVCRDLAVRNIGNANLILDQNWVASLQPDFSFEGGVPDTIKPDGLVDTLRFCFHPNVKGSTGGNMKWGTNLLGKYQGQFKDTSFLTGYGIAPGMSWDRHHQNFPVECDHYDTVRVWLDNTSSGNEGADLTVNDIHLIGPDTNQFTILDYGANPLPFQSYFLRKDSAVWVDLQFKADLSKGYTNRVDSIVANGIDQANHFYTDTMQLTGVDRHAIMAFNPPSYNFGLLNPGQQVTKTFTLTNTGDTNYDFSTLDLPGSDFKILSGPNVGDSLAPNATDTFVIQFTAKSGGGQSSATLTSDDNQEMACVSNALPLNGASLHDSVATAGTTYPVTYICHSGASSVSTWNPGTVPMFLDSVEIVDNGGGSDASQLTFDSTKNQLISFTPSLVIDTGAKLSFPVTYTPTSKGQVNAEVIYFFEDTAYYADSTVSSHTRYFSDTDAITGIGYATANTVALANPTTTNGQYSAVTAHQVSMPVRLIAPFDSIAQIYGVEFTLRYKRDLFVFQPPVQPNMGLQVVNNPQPVADPTDKNYELLTIHLGGSIGPITDTGAVATINWQYVIAKDSTTPFQIQDLMFLDNTGSSVCWVTKDSVPTTFYGRNLCGDATLRDYLKGGMPVLSVGSVVPNPVKQTAAVSFNVLESGVPVTLQVYNALGQPVQTILKDEPRAKGSYQETIDASNLPSGLYTIFLSTPGYGISKQVVVTK